VYTITFRTKSSRSPVIVAPVSRLTASQALQKIDEAEKTGRIATCMDDQGNEVTTAQLREIANNA